MRSLGGLANGTYTTYGTYESYLLGLTGIILSLFHCFFKIIGHKIQFIVVCGDPFIIRMDFVDVHDLIDTR